MPNGMRTGISMNKASQWRLELAQRVGAVYTSHTKVSTVILAGSTARNMSDRHSDIEIDIFWHEPPTDDDRRSTIANAGGEIVGYWPFEDDEWSEVVTFGGLKADTSSFLVETMDRYLAEVVDQAKPDIDMQLLIAAVQHSIVLGESDLELLHAWQDKANTYPDALVEAMVKDALSENPRSYARCALAERGDVLYLHDLLVRTAKRLMMALCGLNRIYVGHPNFKWLDALAAEMTIVPPDFAARLKQVFQAEPLIAVQEFDQLTHEVFDLAEHHFPQINLTAARAKFLETGEIFENPVHLS